MTLQTWMQRNDGDSLILCEGENTQTVAALGRLADQWKQEMGELAHGQVGILPGPVLPSIALLMAISSAGGNAVLLPLTTSDNKPQSDTLDLLIQPLDGMEISLERSHPREIAPSVCGGSLTIYTSGTTGTPRPYCWTWSDLLDRIYLNAEIRQGAWVSAYPLQTFAGIQAMLYLCASAEIGVFLSARRQFSDIRHDGITHCKAAMASPTFWRRVLLTESREALRALTIEILSMGGEPTAQDLLDNLRITFPNTRLVHVYGSTEFGSALSVSDNIAGFPQEWLNRRLHSGIALRVHNGELYMSPRPDAAFLPTGDRVRIESERVYFEGRVVEQINVAGHKISPLQVEAALRAIPCIADVRVYGYSNSITGQIVAADIVLKNGYAPDTVRSVIHAQCREVLSPQARPRRITFMDTIPVTRSGKTPHCHVWTKDEK